MLSSKYLDSDPPKKKGKVKSYKTNDPNDPRLKAYRDSIGMHKMGVDFSYGLDRVQEKEDDYDMASIGYPNKTPSVRTIHQDTYMPKKKPMFGGWYDMDLDELKRLKDWRAKNPTMTEDYAAKGYSDMYKKAVETGIEPTEAMETAEIPARPYFDKPKQEVILQQQESGVGTPVSKHISESKDKVGKFVVMGKSIPFYNDWQREYLEKKFTPYGVKDYKGTGTNYTHSSAQSKMKGWGDDGVLYDKKGNSIYKL